VERTDSDTSPKTRKAVSRIVSKLLFLKKLMAEPTGLEPATSNVTGWRSNQTELRLRDEFKIQNFRFKIMKREF
jgi:hypothetical protein